jgi:hypothetical protein
MTLAKEVGCALDEVNQRRWVDTKSDSNNRRNDYCDLCVNRWDYNAGAIFNWILEEHQDNYPNIEEGGNRR